MTLFIAILTATLVFGLIGMFFRSKNSNKVQTVISSKSRLEFEAGTIFYHEDDFCQIELLPFENFNDLTLQANKYSSKNKSNFDGFGFKEIQVRPEIKRRLESRKIKPTELDALLSQLTTDKHTLVATGYGQSYRIQSHNTISFGKDYSAVYYDFDPNNNVVKNIWFTNPDSLVTAGLPEVLAEISKKWNLILVDWNMNEVTDFRN